MDFKHKLRKRSTKLLDRINKNMDMLSHAYIPDFNADEIPSTDTPIWILGKEYNALTDSNKIKKDIESRLWFTYRKGFSPIGSSGLTSDKGWGCMLRCGQMLLAQALLCSHLGRDWRWDADCKEDSYLRILKMFEDTNHSNYSIHKIAMGGIQEGKDVGEWFGPNTVAQVLKHLVKSDKWSSLQIHVASDNTLVVNDVKRLCSVGNVWKKLVLVIPLRLGIQNINSVYVDGIKKCFTFPQSLGVIGGKPNHALFFIGYADNNVIFLDPHTNQNAGSISKKDHESERKLDCTYHCPQVRMLDILDMDPSIAVCFLCKTEAEFTSLCDLIKEKLMPEKQSLFDLVEDRHDDWKCTNMNISLNAPSCSLNSSSSSILNVSSDEDFEIIG